jgi:hypothetical protein
MPDPEAVPGAERPRRGDHRRGAAALEVCRVTPNHVDAGEGPGNQDPVAPHQGTGIDPEGEGVGPVPIENRHRLIGAGSVGQLTAGDPVGREQEGFPGPVGAVRLQPVH